MPTQTLLSTLAILLAAFSGVPGLFWRRQGSVLATFLIILSSVAALTSVGLAFAGYETHASTEAINLLSGLSSFHPVVDGLSAVFLGATAIVAAASSLYSVGYWKNEEHPVAPATRLFLGLMVAAIFGVEVAGDALSFLVSWEVMALCAFALVLSLHRDPAVRYASWLYLITTRFGTLTLFLAFALFAFLTGGFSLVAMPTGIASTSAGGLLFILFLIGFGLKAGMVPFHFWLPPAHAAAPSHVSALMSGVLIKTGIYGLCRFCSLVPDPPLWWGGTIFALGAVSAVLGVAWALGSHDLKRLLAYHSIENIGIILLGLGLAMVGRSLGQPLLVVLGFSGALLHVLNHAIFKSLLFLGAGAVDHACHTRAIDRLGGLSKAMPVTSACFLVGAAAICGLPPFNGFASEFLIYLGLFSGSTSGWLWSVAGLTALVLTGGLALACFAKACGIVFLGEARTPQARLAKEAGKPERLAMIFLAVLCLAIGLGLPLLTPLLNTATQIAAPGVSLPNLSGHTHPIAITCGSTAIILLGIILWRWQSARLCSRKNVGTWDCGYAAPNARMQYTATSFAAPLTGQLGGVVQSDQQVPHLKVADERPAEPAGLLPQEASFHDHPRDLILDRLLTPLGNIVAWCCLRVRIMHHGHMPIYLLYIVVTMILLFLWSIR